MIRLTMSLSLTRTLNDYRFMYLCGRSGLVGEGIK